jgi:hypothetical protein
MWIRWIRIRIRNTACQCHNLGLTETSLADPGPGSCAFLAPGSRMGIKSRSGSGRNSPDHISRSLETVFWVKNSLMRIGIRDPESL